MAKSRSDPVALPIGVAVLNRMSDVTSGNWVSQGQRAWIRAAAPVTSDAAYDVPEIRTEPRVSLPWLLLAR